MTWLLAQICQQTDSQWLGVEPIWLWRVLKISLRDRSTYLYGQCAPIYTIFILVNYLFYWRVAWSKVSEMRCTFLKIKYLVKEWQDRLKGCLLDCGHKRTVFPLRCSTMEVGMWFARGPRMQSQHDGFSEYRLRLLFFLSTFCTADSQERYCFLYPSLIYFSIMHMHKTCTIRQILKIRIRCVIFQIDKWLVWKKYINKTFYKSSMICPN